MALPPVPSPNRGNAGMDSGQQAASMGGPPGLGSLFANGMPKLRSGKGVTTGRGKYLLFYHLVDVYIDHLVNINVLLLFCLYQYLQMACLRKPLIHPLLNPHYHHPTMPQSLKDHLQSSVCHLQRAIREVIANPTSKAIGNLPMLLLLHLEMYHLPLHNTHLVIFAHHRAHFQEWGELKHNRQAGATCHPLLHRRPCLQAVQIATLAIVALLHPLLLLETNPPSPQSRVQNFQV